MDITSKIRALVTAPDWDTRTPQDKNRALVQLLMGSPEFHQLSADDRDRLLLGIQTKLLGPKSKQGKAQATTSPGVPRSETDKAIQQTEPLKAPVVDDKLVADFSKRFLSTQNPQANIPIQTAYALAENPHDKSWRERLAKMHPVSQAAILRKAADIRASKKEAEVQAVSTRFLDRRNPNANIPLQTAHALANNPTDPAALDRLSKMAPPTREAISRKVSDLSRGDQQWSSRAEDVAFQLAQEQVLGSPYPFGVVTPEQRRAVGMTALMLQQGKRPTFGKYLPDEVLGASLAKQGTKQLKPKTAPIFTAEPTFSPVTEPVQQGAPRTYVRPVGRFDPTLLPDYGADVPRGLFDVQSAAPAQPSLPFTDPRGQMIGQRIEARHAEKRQRPFELSPVAGLWDTVFGKGFSEAVAADRSANGQAMMMLMMMTDPETMPLYLAGGHVLNSVFRNFLTSAVARGVLTNKHLIRIGAWATDHGVDLAFGAPALYEAKHAVDRGELDTAAMMGALALGPYALLSAGRVAMRGARGASERVIRAREERTLQRHLDAMTPEQRAEIGVGGISNEQALRAQVARSRAARQIESNRPSFADTLIAQAEAREGTSPIATRNDRILHEARVAGMPAAEQARLNSLLENVPTRKALRRRLQDIFDRYGDSPTAYVLADELLNRYGTRFYGSRAIRERIRAARAEDAAYSRMRGEQHTAKADDAYLTERERLAMRRAFRNDLIQAHERSLASPKSVLNEGSLLGRATVRARRVLPILYRSLAEEGYVPQVQGDNAPEIFSPDAAAPLEKSRNPRLQALGRAYRAVAEALQSGNNPEGALRWLTKARHDAFPQRPLGSADSLPLDLAVDYLRHEGIISPDGQRLSDTAALGEPGAQTLLQYIAVFAPDTPLGTSIRNAMGRSAVLEAQQRLGAELRGVPSEQPLQRNAPPRQFRAADSYRHYDFVDRAINELVGNDTPQRQARRQAARKSLAATLGRQEVATSAQQREAAEAKRIVGNRKTRPIAEEAAEPRTAVAPRQTLRDPAFLTHLREVLNRFDQFIEVLKEGGEYAEGRRKRLLQRVQLLRDGIVQRLLVFAGDLKATRVATADEWLAAYWDRLDLDIEAVSPELAREWNRKRLAADPSIRPWEFTQESVRDFESLPEVSPVVEPRRAAQPETRETVLPQPEQPATPTQAPVPSPDFVHVQPRAPLVEPTARRKVEQFLDSLRAARNVLEQRATWYSEQTRTSDADAIRLAIRRIDAFILYVQQRLDLHQETLQGTLAVPDMNLWNLWRGLRIDDPRTPLGVPPDVAAHINVNWGETWKPWEFTARVDEAASAPTPTTPDTPEAAPAPKPSSPRGPRPKASKQEQAPSTSAAAPPEEPKPAPSRRGRKPKEETAPTVEAAKQDIAQSGRAEIVTDFEAALDRVTRLAEANRKARELGALRISGGGKKWYRNLDEPERVYVQDLATIALGVMEKAGAALDDAIAKLDEFLGVDLDITTRSVLQLALNDARSEIKNPTTTRAVGAMRQLIFLALEQHSKAIAKVKEDLSIEALTKAIDEGSDIPDSIVQKELDNARVVLEDLQALAVRRRSAPDFSTANPADIDLDIAGTIAEIQGLGKQLIDATRAFYAIEGTSTVKGAINESRAALLRSLRDSLEDGRSILEMELSNQLVPSKVFNDPIIDRYSAVIAAETRETMGAKPPPAEQNEGEWRPAARLAQEEAAAINARRWKPVEFVRNNTNNPRRWWQESERPDPTPIDITVRVGNAAFDGAAIVGMLKDMDKDIEGTVRRVLENPDDAEALRRLRHLRSQLRNGSLTDTRYRLVYAYLQRAVTYRMVLDLSNYKLFKDDTPISESARTQALVLGSKPSKDKYVLRFRPKNHPLALELAGTTSMVFTNLRERQIALTSLVNDLKAEILAYNAVDLATSLTPTERAYRQRYSVFTSAMDTLRDVHPMSRSRGFATFFSREATSMRQSGLNLTPEERYTAVPILEVALSQLRVLSTAGFDVSRASDALRRVINFLEASSKAGTGYKPATLRRATVLWNEFLATLDAYARAPESEYYLAVKRARADLQTIASELSEQAYGDIVSLGVNVDEAAEALKVAQGQQREAARAYRKLQKDPKATDAAKAEALAGFREAEIATKLAKDHLARQEARFNNALKQSKDTANALAKLAQHEAERVFPGTRPTNVEKAPAAHILATYYMLRDLWPRAYSTGRLQNRLLSLKASISGRIAAMERYAAEYDRLKAAALASKSTLDASFPGAARVLQLYDPATGPGAITRLKGLLKDIDAHLEKLSALEASLKDTRPSISGGAFAAAKAALKDLPRLRNIVQTALDAEVVVKDAFAKTEALVSLVEKETESYLSVERGLRYYKAKAAAIPEDLARIKPDEAITAIETLLDKGFKLGEAVRARVNAVSAVDWRMSALRQATDLWKASKSRAALIKQAQAFNEALQNILAPVRPALADIYRQAFVREYIAAYSDIWDRRLILGTPKELLPPDTASSIAVLKHKLGPYWAVLEQPTVQAAEALLAQLTKANLSEQRLATIRRAYAEISTLIDTFNPERMPTDVAKPLVHFPGTRFQAFSKTLATAARRLKLDEAAKAFIDAVDAVGPDQRVTDALVMQRYTDFVQRLSRAWKIIKARDKALLRLSLPEQFLVDIGEAKAEQAKYAFISDQDFIDATRSLLASSTDDGLTVFRSGLSGDDIKALTIIGLYFLERGVNRVHDIVASFERLPGNIRSASEAVREALAAKALELGFSERERLRNSVLFELVGKNGMELVPLILARGLQGFSAGEKITPAALRERVLKHPFMRHRASVDMMLGPHAVHSRAAAIAEAYARPYKDPSGIVAFMLVREPKAHIIPGGIGSVALDIVRTVVGADPLSAGFTPGVSQKLAKDLLPRYMRSLVTYMTVGLDYAGVGAKVTNQIVRAAMRKLTKSEVQENAAALTDEHPTALAHKLSGKDTIALAKNAKVHDAITTKIQEVVDQWAANDGGLLTTLTTAIQEFKSAGSKALADGDLRSGLQYAAAIRLFEPISTAIKQGDPFWRGLTRGTMAVVKIAEAPVDVLQTLFGAESAGKVPYQLLDQLGLFSTQIKYADAGVFRMLAPHYLRLLRKKGFNLINYSAGYVPTGEHVHKRLYPESAFIVIDPRAVNVLPKYQPAGRSVTHLGVPEEPFLSRVIDNLLYKADASKAGPEYFQPSGIERVSLEGVSGKPISGGVEPVESLAAKDVEAAGKAATAERAQRETAFMERLKKMGGKLYSGDPIGIVAQAIYDLFVSRSRASGAAAPTVPPVNQLINTIRAQLRSGSTLDTVVNNIVRDLGGTVTPAVRRAVISATKVLTQQAAQQAQTAQTAAAAAASAAAVAAQPAAPGRPPTSFIGALSTALHHGVVGTIESIRAYRTPVTDEIAARAMRGNLDARRLKARYLSVASRLAHRVLREWAHDASRRDLFIDSREHPDPVVRAHARAQLTPAERALSDFYTRFVRFMGRAAWESGLGTEHVAGSSGGSTHHNLVGVPVTWVDWTAGQQLRGTIVRIDRGRIPVVDVGGREVRIPDGAVYYTPSQVSPDSYMPHSIQAQYRTALMDVKSPEFAAASQYVLETGQVGMPGRVKDVGEITWRYGSPAQGQPIEVLAYDRNTNALMRDAQGNVVRLASQPQRVIDRVTEALAAKATRLLQATVSHDTPPSNLPRALPGRRRTIAIPYVGPAAVERARIGFRLPAYMMDDPIGVMLHHIDRAANRLAFARAFGRDGERLAELAARAARATGIVGVEEDLMRMVRIALDIRENMPSPTYSGIDRYLRAESAFISTALLTGLGTTYRQLTTLGNTAGVLGALRAVRGAIQGLTDRRIIQRLRMAGVIDSAQQNILVVDDPRLSPGDISSIALAVTGVTPVDTMLRYHAGITGRIAVIDAVRSLAQRQGAINTRTPAYRLLAEWFEYTPDDIQAMVRQFRADPRRLFSWSSEGRMWENIAFYGGVKTQGIVARERLPELFTKTPQLKWLLRLQTFNLAQMRILTWAVKEARHGNPMPFIYLTLAYGVGNIGYEKLIELFGGEKKKRLSGGEIWQLIYHSMRGGMYGYLEPLLLPLVSEVVDAEGYRGTTGVVKATKEQVLPAGGQLWLETAFPTTAGIAAAVGEQVARSAGAKATATKFRKFKEAQPTVVDAAYRTVMPFRRAVDITRKAQGKPVYKTRPERYARSQ